MIKRISFALILFCSIFASSILQAQEKAPAKLNFNGKAKELNKGVNELKKQMYTPFVELYILEELRNLRNKQLQLEAELIEKIADRELEVADKSMSYATDTVTYFFYLIAGCTSLLVLVGWTSVKDIREKVQSYADEQVSKLVIEYEKRLYSLEKELDEKTKDITENQEQIEETNEVHSLWLKANQETLPQDKIAIYDQILKIRPDDTEALTFKADAALQLNEPMWAISLCDIALNIDPDNAHGYYQKSCANSVLGNTAESIAQLRQAIAISDSFREVAGSDSCFEAIADTKEFQEIVNDAIQLKPDEPFSK